MTDKVAKAPPIPYRPAVPAPREKPAGIAELLWLSWTDPLRIWSNRHFEEPILYGDTRLGRAMAVNDPAALREVLVDKAGDFHKDDLQRRVLGPMIAEGLFMAEGDDWRRMRRILAPLFNPRRTAASSGQMKAVAQARIATWPKAGGVISIDQEMTRLTFEILSATLFSGALGGEADDFEKALNAFVGAAARIDPLDVIGAPAWIPRIGRVLAGGAGAFFQRRVGELVVERRAILAKGGEAPDDLLTALLKAQDPETGVGLTDTQVASNILTFILAGHETTARALGWTLYLLARSPHVLAELVREADALDLGKPDWADALPWTTAAFEEAMRLFPPAPVFTRMAMKETTIAGRRMRPGTVMLIVPWVLHRHRRLWDDPDAFKPERFLPGARESIDRFAYIPFGAGPRVCIGASFAQQEALIALTTIVRGFHLEPADASQPTPTHRITLRSKEGIRLKVTPR